MWCLVGFEKSKKLGKSAKISVYCEFKLTNPLQITILHLHPFQQSVMHIVPKNCYFPHFLIILGGTNLDFYDF